MIAVVVEIDVAAGREEEFKRIALKNARASEAEEGCTQFAVIQSQEASYRFMLYETYRSPDAITSHKETPHFAEWSTRTAAETGLIVAKAARRYNVL